MFLGRNESGLPRRTKIVATLGPASSDPEIIEALIRAGLDVARLNFSHGDHDSHRQMYEKIRAAADRARKPVGILQDLQGPKIRLGKLDGSVILGAGEEAVISSEADFIGTRARMPSTYPRLANDVKVGEPLLLADGSLELEVTAIDGADVICKVLVGGTVTSNKGINLPKSTLSVPSLVDKDRRDLEFGMQLGVDYVALSFVRVPHDIIVVRELMDALGRRVPIIAKIEKPEAVERLESIIDASDGIMVARGDLGVELPAEQVPPLQRRAIRLARERGQPTIVATQMLVSMTKHPRPTHAEVSDVANAVFDGTGAVMLSEETAAGVNPVRAVETMSAIVSSAEAAAVGKDLTSLVSNLRDSYPGAVSRAAVVTAKDLGAKAIVSFTHKGLGPRLISDWRPSCEIFGLSPSKESANRMAMLWGVRPITIGNPKSFEGLVAEFERVNAAQNLLPPGTTVVITSKIPFVQGQLSNMFKLHTVGGDHNTIMGRDSLTPSSPKR